MKVQRKILFVMLLMLLSVSAAAQEICVHDFRPAEEAPTCTEPGYRGFVCSLCAQSTDFVSVPALGHAWDEWEITELSTCKSMGMKIRTCLRCEDKQEKEIPKEAHSYSVWVQKPTCSLNGYTLHTCLYCGHEERTDRVESLGHDLQVLVVEPTCAQDGYTKYQCTRCTYYRKENLVEKKGHQWDTGMILSEAGLDKTGKIRYTCLSCDETRTDVIPYWEHPFVDVEPSAYYRDGITWAYHRGITNGTDETHFAPEEFCTRAQVVTFLWRWAGSPEPNAFQHGFADVKAGSYYEKAVVWALEKGVTKGVDAIHFAPDAVCTRGQVVTLIHRYLGSPAAKGVMPFTDVSAERFYASSVLWAYKNKITTGTTQTLFNPEGACTRGQIVTFLFRANEL